MLLVCESFILKYSSELILIQIVVLKTITGNNSSSSINAPH